MIKLDPLRTAKTVIHGLLPSTIRILIRKTVFVDPTLILFIDLAKDEQLKGSPLYYKMFVHAAKTIMKVWDTVICYLSQSTTTAEQKT